ncbi:very low-density lipoprotein receptor-like [Narcine bancroftii]|uniref:very low-density lipoprotein receptor-like n=1 Tax=Narcine bancroftii TaxID=1343680 RepID=UPI00383153CA
MCGVGLLLLLLLVAAGVLSASEDPTRRAWPGGECRQPRQSVDPPVAGDLGCIKDDFLCSDGHCISALMMCNGRADCSDGSDEQNCTVSECGPHEFQCSNSSDCISKYWLCDGYQHCPSGVDESDDLCKDTAVKLGNCGEFEFLCNSGQCIELQSACDNFPDCTDGSDEVNCDRNECLEANGKCSDYCWDLPLGYECACPAGLELINHFTCGGEEPFVIFTNHGNIRKLSINRMEPEELTDGVENAEAVDVNVDLSTVYWSDATCHGIFSKSMDQEYKQILSDVQRIGGIAVDWIYDHIYWTESRARTLSFATLDGLRRKTLFSGNLEEPAAVVVDPYSGVLYWADVGEPAKIEKAGMDGVGRRIMVSVEIEKPTGLALDIVHSRLYWVDAGLHELFYSDLDGHYRGSAFHSNKYLANPFGLAVFESRVYWSDEGSGTLYSADKFTGANMTVLAQNLSNPHGLVILHKLMQPIVKNWCVEAHAACEFLCVPALQTAQRYACLCPDDMKPDETGCGCEMESQVDGTHSGMPWEGGADSSTPQESGTDSSMPQEAGADSSTPQEDGANSSTPQGKPKGTDPSYFDAVTVIILMIVILTGTAACCAAIHWRMILCRVKKPHCYSSVHLNAESSLRCSELCNDQCTDNISQHSLL